jgi:Lrp/AsnC family leucine-responsive transcriptional regulator
VPGTSADALSRSVVETRETVVLVTNPVNTPRPAGRAKYRVFPGLTQWRQGGTCIGRTEHAEKTPSTYHGPMSAVDLDQTDHKIIELLSQNARRTMADIGERVSLSASAVTRRIERLERSGVIAGYTVVVDHRKAGRPIQAFTEVRYAGTADLKEIKETAIQLPEVQAVFTTAGDPDALVWLQVPDVERLGQVIEQLRRRGRVTGTKTLIVLDTWSRHRAFEPDRSAAARRGSGP